MLETIALTATEDKPAVHFDPHSGILAMKGRSLPENANNFFDPLIEWFEQYAHDPKQDTLVDFHLDYFNSSSASKIVKLLIALEEIPALGYNVLVKWHYAPDDDMMKARGEELQNIIDLPFEMIEL